MTIQESVAQEYLNGGITQFELGIKYGIHPRTVRKWLLKHRRSLNSQPNPSEFISLPAMKNKPAKPMPTDVTELQKELERERLKTQLLNAMIDIAEKQLKIPIRKKSGTKQSSK
jgi:transposase-like protein